MAKVDFKDLDLEETKSWVEKWGLEGYRAEQIRRWVTEGASRRQVFGEMNKLLQSEFIGGKITNTELRNGIKYAIELSRAGQ